LFLGKALNRSIKDLGTQERKRPRENSKKKLIISKLRIDRGEKYDYNPSMT
jgi:hypothetical protein